MKVNVIVFCCVCKIDNNWIVRVIGVIIVNRVEDFQEFDVGIQCGLFEIEKIGDEYFIFFIKCKLLKVCIVFFRGFFKDVFNEIECNFQDVMGVVCNVMFYFRLLFGGGVIEMVVFVRLQQFVKSIEGVQQWFYKVVVEVFEVIFWMFIQNVGKFFVRVLIDFWVKYVEGKSLWGVNGDIGLLVDMKEYGVWELEVIKVQSMKIVIEVWFLILFMVLQCINIMQVVCFLFRVDDICSVKKL